MIKSPRMFNQGLLVVTKDQEEAMHKIRATYDNFEAVRFIMENREDWNTQAPQTEEASAYASLGDIELSDLITVAVTGRFTSEVNKIHLIERCMEDAYGRDSEVSRVLGDILTLFKEYRTKEEIYNG